VISGPLPFRCSEARPSEFAEPPIEFRAGLRATTPASLVFSTGSRVMGNSHRHILISHTRELIGHRQSDFRCAEFLSVLGYNTRCEGIEQRSVTPIPSPSGRSTVSP
jgi:hypothetical protein